MQYKYCQNCGSNTKQVFVETIWRCEECFNTHSEFLPHPESLLHEIKLEGSYIIQLNEKIEHLQARVQELEQERRWISVSERLPEEGQPVLIDFGNNEITVGIWFWENEPEEWSNGTDYVGWQHWNYGWNKFEPSDEPPTHWMPLPDRPESEEECLSPD